MLPAKQEANFFPLPSKMASVAKNARHPGLLMTRLTPWQGATEPIGEKNRLEFLEKIAAGIPRESEHLAAVHARQERLTENRRARQLDFTLSTSLAIGLAIPTPLETGLTLDLLTGLPILPASGLKGMIRAWLRDRENLGEEKVDELLAGLVVLDAFPLSPPKLAVDILTPHQKDYYESSGSKPPLDTSEPSPTTFLVVKPGTSFRVRFWLRPGSNQSDVTKRLEKITGALTAALTRLGAGAKTAAGYGLCASNVLAEADEEAIRVRLQVVTPVFIGSAKPKLLTRPAPFRPGSIRGALRDWFRRAMACRIGNTQDKKWSQGLFDLESKIFGNSTGHPSRLVIDSRSNLESMIFGAPGRKAQAGIAYLGYGPYQYEKGQGQVQKAEAVMPGSHVEVSFRFRWRKDDDEKVKNAIRDCLLSCLWLWTHFGGLGKRTRRGFGGLWLTDLQGWGLESWGDHFGSLEDSSALNQRLQQGLNFVNSSLEKAAMELGGAWQGGSTPRAGYSTLVPPRAVIVPTEDATGKNAWEIALNDIGLRYKCFRGTLDRNRFRLKPLPDYFFIKDFLQDRPTSQRLQQVPRASFGLPLQFYFRSIGGKTAFVSALSTEPGKIEEKKINRRVSPVFFKLIPVGDKIVTLVMYMPGPLLPENTGILLSDQSGRRKARLDISPSDSLVLKFLDELRKGMGKK